MINTTRGPAHKIAGWQHLRHRTEDNHLSVRLILTVVRVLGVSSEDEKAACFLPGKLSSQRFRGTSGPTWWNAG